MKLSKYRSLSLAILSSVLIGALAGPIRAQGILDTISPEVRETQGADFESKARALEELFGLAEDTGPQLGQGDLGSNDLLKIGAADLKRFGGTGGQARNLILGDEPEPEETTPGNEEFQRLSGVLDGLFTEAKAAEKTPASNQLPVPAKKPGTGVDLKSVDPNDVVDFRLLGHANQPLKLLMVCTGNFRQDTRDEVQGVLEAVRALNAEAEGNPDIPQTKLQLILGSQEDMNRINLTQEDLDKHVEINPYFASRDIWLQDWGEIAGVHVEGASKERLTIFDSNRGRGLAELPKILAKMWNSHYIKGPPGQGAGNYGGNIEVTPDDLLVIGDSSSTQIRDQFKAMGYEGKTIVLETKWLLVGHVDEYLSFLPNPDTPLGYTVVVGDPGMAMDLLEEVPEDQFEAKFGHLFNSAFARSKEFPEILDQDKRGFSDLAKKVAAMYLGKKGKPVTGRYDSARLIADNQEASTIVERNVQTLIQALKARYGEDLEVPLVRVPILMGKNRGQFAALTPGVANMVVLRNHLVVPDPLLENFQAKVREGFEGAGYTPHLIPNLTYHIGVGQLHCGTNTFRHPNKYVHPRFQKFFEARAKAKLRGFRANRAE